MCRPKARSNRKFESIPALIYYYIVMAWITQIEFDHWEARGNHFTFSMILPQTPISSVCAAEVGYSRHGYKTTTAGYNGCCRHGHRYSRHGHRYSATWSKFNNLTPAPRVLVECFRSNHLRGFERPYCEAPFVKGLWNPTTQWTQWPPLSTLTS